MLLQIAAFGLGAALPIAVPRTRNVPGARDAAFYGTVGAGVLALVTGSSLLGAIAYGSAGAWTVLAGDDLIRKLP